MNTFYIYKVIIYILVSSNPSKSLARFGKKQNINSNIFSHDITYIFPYKSSRPEPLTSPKFVDILKRICTRIHSIKPTKLLKLISSSDIFKNPAWHTAVYSGHFQQLTRSISQDHFYVNTLLTNIICSKRSMFLISYSKIMKRAKQNLNLNIEIGREVYQQFSPKGKSFKITCVNPCWNIGQSQGLIQPKNDNNYLFWVLKVWHPNATFFSLSVLSKTVENENFN